MTTNTKTNLSSAPTGLKIRTNLRAGALLDDLQSNVTKIWNQLVSSPTTSSATVAAPPNAADASNTQTTN